MEKWFRIGWITLLILTSFVGLSQQFYTKTAQLNHVEVFDVQTPDSSFLFKSQLPITALAIKSQRGETFFYELSGVRSLIPRDEDVNEPTYFISLPTPVVAIRLIVPAGVQFGLYAIQSGQSPEILSRKAREQIVQDCAEPIEYVPQSTWRQGLPAPNNTRSFHQVFHNIIHHSAGSNSNTNYTQVVRDIYLYHTEVNGWSDIGYNYLISQDGTTFAGRDPGAGSRDNVRGAHFCGANSGTLGVCLLGNFETAVPSNEAWSSLESLLTYQLLNQGLDPFGSYNHSLGSLGTIAGHREGCATLCPGENVFNQLQNLKTSLATKIEGCQPGLQLSFEVDTLVEVGQLVQFTNTSEGYKSFTWILEGAFPQRPITQHVTTSYSVPGIYDVTLIGQSGESTDTLIYSDYIHASLLANQPVTFPNPGVSHEILTIDHREEINKIELFESSGKLVGEWNNKNEIKLPQTRPGIYILTITSNGRKFNSKLIVN